MTDKFSTGTGISDNTGRGTDAMTSSTDKPASTGRKPIPKKVRFEVFKRDGFICAYCGAHPPAVVLQVDHIEPVSKGGTNAIDNLIGQGGE